MRALAVFGAYILVMGGSLAEAGDPGHGETLWKKCKACHQIGDGAKNRVGPQLNDLIGRAAGSADDFRYSEAMTAAGAQGLVWDAETLDRFLEDPRKLLGRTRMSFRGFNKPGDRADMIAFLSGFSSEEESRAENASEVNDGVKGLESALALDPEILAIDGDRDYGEYLASECLTCHERQGRDDGIPAIIGWPVKNFVVAMHAYKQKVRPHPVMQMMAGRLSNEEIAGLAAYFHGLE